MAGLHVVENIQCAFLHAHQMQNNMRVMLAAVSEISNPATLTESSTLPLTTLVTRSKHCIGSDLQSMLAVLVCAAKQAMQRARKSGINFPI